MKSDLWCHKTISKKTTGQLESWPQKSCELSGITGKWVDFSKIKLFCQRDNTDVSRKKLAKKKFEKYVLMSFKF